MRKIIVTGHAKISEGIASAVEFIVGKHIPYFNAYLEGEGHFLDRIRQEIDGCNPEDEMIIFTDMLGGSVNNEMLQFISRPKTHLITGMNLALVLSVSLSEEDEDIEGVIQENIAQAREGIVYCNEVIEQNNDEDGGLDEF